VRDSARHALTSTGWQVRTVENGRAALECLATFRPHVIVLDLLMPVMDGFDFLVELRAVPEWREIPVVILTAKDLTDADRQALSGRVEQVVAKDAWSDDQLVDLVRQAARANGPQGCA
jgi:CheY-like chemotaxis protein